MLACPPAPGRRAPAQRTTQSLQRERSSRIHGYVGRDARQKHELVGTSWCALGFIKHSPLATSWKTSASRSLATPQKGTSGARSPKRI
ncbi:hypothetical protein BDA96_03G427100 [Sorghum bicolor]|uniref:Uncharacterized protein n=2 Tax=Sorghum bicolor TaxID=4558 RepID=A0A921RIY0_SORBI|nr:hypothetical protein BDA96_03G427100 [Sorghum bicolor]OQU88083.1 hypothetical protein SORBI_3003G396050 [Sorghum bicolor]